MSENEGLGHLIRQIEEKRIELNILVDKALSSNRKLSQASILDKSEELDILIFKYQNILDKSSINHK